MKVVFSGFPDWALRRPAEVKEWLGVLAHEYGWRIGQLQYTFVDNAEIVRINERFLNHKYATDIITFEYSDGKYISGDIFISLDTVASNAVAFNVTIADELDRVIAHGLLHLIGFDDKGDEDRALMREEEEKCLILRAKIGCEN